MIENAWFKFVALLGFSAFILFDLIYFSNLSHGTKYKIYVMEFYVLFTCGVFMVSRYFWKCFVTELLKNQPTTTLTRCWKLFLLTYFFLAHCAQFTNLFGYMEPSAFQWLSWVSFGSFSIFTCTFVPARFIFWFLNRNKKAAPRLVSYEKLTIFFLIANLVISTSSYFSAMDGPDVVK